MKTFEKAYWPMTVGNSDGRTVNSVEEFRKE